jgi:thiol-disulfide isomerase/thioredoxin
MRYFFYGTECPHCHTMMPLVDKMIAEGISIEKLETWHNEENAKKFEAFDTGLCGGVPFFYNDENKKFICGETTEEHLIEWMEGK